MEESTTSDIAIITFKTDYEAKMEAGEGYDNEYYSFEEGEREQVLILGNKDGKVYVEFGDGRFSYIPSSLISIKLDEK